MKYEKVYNNIFRKSPEIFFIACSIWTHKNNSISKNLNVQMALIINLAVDLFDDIIDTKNVTVDKLTLKYCEKCPTEK